MTQVSDSVSSPVLRRDPRPERGIDALNRQLRRAEDTIRRRALAVSARVVLRTGFDEEGGGEYVEFLCFGKLDGQRRLYLESGFADRPESLQTRDLFASDIDTRSHAVKKIPALVQALEAVDLQCHEDPASLARELQIYLDRMSRAEP